LSDGCFSKGVWVQAYLIMCAFIFECDMSNLAVVGAGVGGCFAAYFARKYLSGVKITIFDSKDRIGGRILTCDASGVNLELGAAFFNAFNRTLLETVRAEQLKIAPVKNSRDFAVWNGSELVFRSANQSFVNNLRLLVKYKLDLARAFLLVRKVRRQVAKLYEETLRKPSELGKIFESIRLDEWYKRQFFEVLVERGISEAFIDKIVTPLTRVIYSQNASLGGFAGISSLIGAYSGSTYRLAKGNSTLPVHLAKASNATIKLSQKVDVIEKTPRGTYRVHAGDDVAVFDTVIVATPLELAGIKFEGIAMGGWEPQQYQVVYKRVMRGVFDPDYFGLDGSAAFPAIVLTTKDAGPITHYSIQRVGDGESLVTISSPEPLSDNVFNGVFRNGGVLVLDHCWEAAYPVFKPVTRVPLTCIDNRLMYLSAAEPVVSSIETSALSALNAVRMLGEG
jgi:hypothetical protein